MVFDFVVDINVVSSVEKSIILQKFNHPSR